MNTSKILLISVCCLVSALWSETQCMEDAQSLLNNYAHKSFIIMDKDKYIEENKKEIIFNLSESKGCLEKLFLLIEDNEEIKLLIKQDCVNKIANPLGKFGAGIELVNAKK